MLLNRNINLFSIAHEEEWIHEEITCSKIHCIRVFSIQNVKNAKWSPYLLHLSKDKDSSVPHVDDYLAPLKKRSNSSLDIVFVDESRASVKIESITRSMNLLKDGGIIILDNSDRTHYEDAFKLLEDWSLLKTACITNASEFVTPGCSFEKTYFIMRKKIIIRHEYGQFGNILFRLSNTLAYALEFGYKVEDYTLCVLQLS